MKYFTYDTNLRDRNLYTSTVNTPFGIKRYFSSLDSEIFFGATQIEEVFAIDFTVAEPKLPIYSYNSFYPNRIVAGRRTVQGTFAINFTNTKYILNILDSIDDSVLKNDYEALIYRCPGEDSTGLGIGNSAIFTKQFDITISYGYGKSDDPSYNGCYQTLVGVQIVDYRQALDTEGNPILDMFRFIAKDIRYDTVQGGGTDKGIVDGNPETEPSDEEELVPDVMVAGVNDIEAANKIRNECTADNKRTSGFLVGLILTRDNGKYYLTLMLDTTNNEETEEFKDVYATITDQQNGINLLIGFQKAPIGYTTQELTGALREMAIKACNKAVKDSSYMPECLIEFTAVVNQTYVPIDCETTVTIELNQ